MLGPISQGYNIDNERVLRLIKILAKPEMNNDDVHFLDLFLKQYAPPEVKEIKQMLTTTDFQALMKKTKHQKAGMDEFLVFTQDIPDILYVLRGKVQVKSSDGTFIKEYLKNECFFNEAQKGQSYSVFSQNEQTDLLVISREYYQVLLSDHERQQQITNLKALYRICPPFRRVENKASLLDMFENKHYQKNTVISLPTVGVLRLSIIMSGKVGLFLHKKVKDDYLIFGVLSTGQVFNDNAQLFSSMNNYGVLILEDDTNVLTLKPGKNFPLLNDEVLNQLRADCLARRNLYSTRLTKLLSLDSQQLQLTQQQLLQHHHVPLKVLSYLYDHEKNGKVQTDEQLKNKDKNIAKFDEFLLKNGPTNKDDKAFTMSTNRIVGRRSDFNQMNLEKQRSLLTLQNLGAMRKGNVQSKPSLGESSAIDTKSIKNLQSRKKNLMSMI